MRTLSLLFMLLCSPLFAQISEPRAEVRYYLAGVETFEVVEDLIFIPEESKPVTKQMGWIYIDVEPNSNIKIKAKTEDGQRLVVKQFTKGDSENPAQFGVLGTGKIWIDVVVINFDTQDFDWEEFQLNIGDDDPPSPPNPNPDDPDPPPDPNVPDDRFDNIGQRVRVKVADRPAVDIGKVFWKYATMVSTDGRFTINEIRGKLNTELNARPDRQDFDEVYELINQDVTSRWNGQFTREVLKEYWQAIARGFGYNGT